MPRVPIVDQNTVRDTALPGVRVDTTQSESAFGGGRAAEQVNAAAHGLNEDTQKFILKKREEADDLVVQEADLNASKAQTDIQVKVSQMQGKDSLEAPDYADTEWKKQSDAIREGLSTENQRQRFDKIRAARYADIYRATQVHVATETQKYDTAMTEAYLENSKNEAANNYLDIGPDGRVQTSLIQQEAALRKFADRHGIPDELVKKQIEKSKSDTLKGVVEQMLNNNNDTMADAYYKQIKDQILPDDREKLDQAIEKSVLLGNAQREADKVFGKYANNRNAAFEFVKNKIKDDNLRKETENQLDRMFTRKSLGDRQENQKTYQIASQMVEKNQEPPSTLRIGMTAEQNAALDRRLKQVNAGIQPNTDWSKYYELKTLAASDKNSFIKENLMEYRHILADAEFKDLTNLQGQMSKNDPNADVHLNGYRTSTQIVSDTLMSAGVNTRSKNTKDMQKVATFRRMVDENVQILQEQTGKKAKPEDVQKIADNLLINTIVKGGGWFGMDAKKKIFEIQYKDVPQQDRADITRELRKRNRPVTEQAILQYYLKAAELRGKNGAQ